MAGQTPGSKRPQAAVPLRNTRGDEKAHDVAQEPDLGLEERADLLPGALIRGDREVVVPAGLVPDLGDPAGRAVAGE